VSKGAALISLINDPIEYERGAVQMVNVTRKEIHFFKRYVDEQTKTPEIHKKRNLIEKAYGLVLQEWGLRR